VLVLSRREREWIKLGNTVVVTVVRVMGNRVSLAIEAPRDVPVRRRELDRHSGRNSADQPEPD
jgi:carbon storage regulator